MTDLMTKKDIEDSAQIDQLAKDNIETAIHRIAGADTDSPMYNSLRAYLHEDIVEGASGHNYIYVEQSVATWLDGWEHCEELLRLG